MRLETCTKDEGIRLLGCIFKLAGLIGEDSVCFSSPEIKLRYRKTKQNRRNRMLLI